MTSFQNFESKHFFLLQPDNKYSPERTLTKFQSKFRTSWSKKDFWQTCKWQTRQLEQTSVFCMGALCLTIWPTRALTDQYSWYLDSQRIDHDISIQKGLWQTCKWQTRQSEQTSVFCRGALCLTVWPTRALTDQYSWYLDPKRTLIDL